MDFRELTDEQERAHEKHKASGRSCKDLEWHAVSLWLAIMGEEFGEVCQATQEGTWAEIRAELVQVAAMATAWIDSIDKYKVIDPFSK